MAIWHSRWVSLKERYTVQSNPPWKFSSENTGPASQSERIDIRVRWWVVWCSQRQYSGFLGQRNIYLSTPGLDHSYSGRNLSRNLDIAQICRFHQLYYWFVPNVRPIRYCSKHSFAICLYSVLAGLAHSSEKLELSWCRSHFFSISVVARFEHSLNLYRVMRRQLRNLTRRGPWTLEFSYRRSRKRKDRQMKHLDLSERTSIVTMCSKVMYMNKWPNVNLGRGQ